MMRTAAVAAIILAVSAASVPAFPALAQTPDTTFWVLTDRGREFPVEPPDRIPTTDVVSSPYVEFQRLGGLVASGGAVAEAAKYNTVWPGPTHIISDWGEGVTRGMPNGAPLAGEMRMSPVPHLHLRTPQPISGTTLWPAGISHADTMAGPLTHTIHNHTTHGTYHKFSGSGRALVWLDAVNDFYAVNMVCTDCQTDTPAVVGDIPDGGTGPLSTKLGTIRLAYGTAASCMVDGVSHAGCGSYPAAPAGRDWPRDPRPLLPGLVSHDPYPNRHDAVLHVTRYDTAACPGASHANTEMDMLDGTHFRLVSRGCTMQNYDYEWWDGSVRMQNTLPLRPGLNTWERTPGGHPAIILDMRGGEILLQAYAATTKYNAERAFFDTLSVDHTGMDSDAVIILHDAFSHLGAFTIHTLADIKPYVQTYPQRQAEPGPANLAHSRAPGAGGTGGLLGADCIDGYKYCITTFDGDGLPVINNARGVVYDHRNGAELNRGTDVGNHANVFGAMHFGVPYEAAKLNLVQSYAVIPVTGSVSVDELYLTYGFPGGCDRYVDASAVPHRWTGTPSAGWLRLSYLERDYGGDDTLINIPLLPGYGVVCMLTHGSDGFRQFRTDDFFAQGSHASFGGTRYVSTHSGVLGPNPDWTNIPVLDTDVTLPGTGTRVMDLDLDISGSVTLVGVVDGGGGATGVQDRHRCDWHMIPRETPPRHTPSQSVEMTVYVDIWAPVGGTYERVAGLGARDHIPLSAPRPPVTVGEDCMHISYAEFDFDPEYRTIPVTLGSNTPVKISVTTSVDFGGGAAPVYAGRLPSETLHVETVLDRLSVRVH